MKRNLEQSLIDSIAYYAPAKYAIAVSGGSDSLALLYLMSNLNTSNFTVVHFDHDLRKESSFEENFVKETALNLGFNYAVEKWDKKNIEDGNLYEKAREARYRFFKKIVKEKKLEGILVAHSKTDLAETLLMRLGKGCSVKGASIFPKRTEVFGVNVERPLLKFTRKDLQDYLSAKNIEWMVDESNKDLKKIRPRIRSLLPNLESAGVSLNGILSSCEYFNQANSAIDYYTNQEFASFYFCDELKYYSIDKKSFFEKPLEVQIRLIIKIIKNLNYLNEFKHTPRRKKLIELLNRLNFSKSKKEEIDILNIEIQHNNIFFYNKEHKKDKNFIYLDEINKNLRYNIIKKYNLQTLPENLRYRIKENNSFTVLSKTIKIKKF